MTVSKRPPTMLTLALATAFATFLPALTHPLAHSFAGRAAFLAGDRAIAIGVDHAEMTLHCSIELGAGDAPVTISVGHTQHHACHASTPASTAHAVATAAMFAHAFTALAACTATFGTGFTACFARRLHFFLAQAAAIVGIGFGELFCGASCSSFTALSHAFGTLGAACFTGSLHLSLRHFAIAVDIKARKACGLPCSAVFGIDGTITIGIEALPHMVGMGSGFSARYLSVAIGIRLVFAAVVIGEGNAASRQGKCSGGQSKGNLLHRSGSIVKQLKLRRPVRGRGRNLSRAPQAVWPF